MFQIVVIIATLAQEPFAYGLSNSTYATQAACQKHVANALVVAKHDLPGNLYKGGCLSVEEIAKIVNAAKAEGSI